MSASFFRHIGRPSSRSVYSRLDWWARSRCAAAHVLGVAVHPLLPDNQPAEWVIGRLYFNDLLALRTGSLELSTLYIVRCHTTTSHEWNSRIMEQLLKVSYKLKESIGDANYWVPPPPHWLGYIYSYCPHSLSRADRVLTYTVAYEDKPKHVCALSVPCKFGINAATRKLGGLAEVDEDET